MLCVLVVPLCPALCDPLDCSPPGSPVRGILQARILEGVAILFFRGSSLPKDWTQVPCIAGRFFTIWTTREATELLCLPCKFYLLSICDKLHNQFHHTSTYKYPYTICIYTHTDIYTHTIVWVYLEYLSILTLNFLYSYIVDTLSTHYI